MYPINVGSNARVNIGPSLAGAWHRAKRQEATKEIYIVLEEHQWSASVAMTFLRISLSAQL